MSKIKFLQLIIVKLWQTHRENIVSLCAIISTIVAITGLFLKLAELQQSCQQPTPTERPLFEQILQQLEGL